LGVESFRRVAKKDLKDDVEGAEEKKLIRQFMQAARCQRLWTWSACMDRWQGFVPSLLEEMKEVEEINIDSISRDTEQSKVCLL